MLRALLCYRTMAPIKSRTKFACVLVGVLLFEYTALRGQSRDAATDGNVVHLDPVLIETSAGNPWQFISVSGYEILSHCSDAFNAEYVKALDRSTRAREELLPDRYWGHPGASIKIILYNQEPKSQDNFVQRNPKDFSWSTNGLRLGSGNVETGSPPIAGDGDLFILCGNYWNLQTRMEKLTVDPDSSLRLKIRAPQLPPWLIEGIEEPLGVYHAHLIESVAGNDTLVIPAAIWMSPPETAALDDAFKRSRKKKKPLSYPEMIPLAEFFEVSAPPEKKVLWESEAALLVRWGLLDSSPAGQERRRSFLRFIDDTSTERVTEQLFQKHLALTYREAGQRLKEFLPQAITEELRLPLHAGNDGPNTFRESTPSEVARILASWAEMEARTLPRIQSDLRQEYLARAEKLFQRESKKENHDPLFLAEFGLYKLTQGDEAAAREALQSSIDHRIVRPKAYVELARLHFRSALPSSPRGLGDLKPADFAAIITLLATAQRQMPEFLSTYKVWVEVLQHAPTLPSEADLGVLEDAARRFPQEIGLVLKIANTYKNFGYKTVAMKVVNGARQMAISEDDRRLLAEFSVE